MAEKCWAFGVTFPRDSDFAAELSLFYGDEAASRERDAPDKRRWMPTFFRDRYLLLGLSIRCAKKAVIQRDKS